MLLTIRKVSILSLIIMLTSCAYGPTSFSEKDFDPVKEGIIIGSIEITFNGTIASNCVLQFNQDNTNFLTTIKKDKTFKMSAPNGKMYLKGIKCGQEDYYKFEPNALNFIVTKGITPTFIGNFKIEWETPNYNLAVLGATGVFGLMTTSDKPKKFTIKENSIKSISFSKPYLTSIIKIPKALGN